MPKALAAGFGTARLEIRPGKRTGGPLQREGVTGRGECTEVGHAVGLLVDE